MSDRPRRHRFGRLVEHSNPADPAKAESTLRFATALQKLADKLESLVPKYLAAVPLDPFDNRPKRWDPAAGVIHSVGADFADDHGSFSDPDKSANKDVGMRYRWRGKPP